MLLYSRLLLLSIIIFLCISVQTCTYANRLITLFCQTAVEGVSGTPISTNTGVYNKTQFEKNLQNE